MVPLGMERAAMQAKGSGRTTLVGLVAAAVLATTLLLAVPAFSLPTATQSMGKGGEFARDCVAETSLSRERPGAARFLVWCGVQAGKVSFSLKRGDHLPFRSFPRQISPRGTGAAGAFGCRLVGRTVKCAGRVNGPVTIRGLVGIAPATRCAPLVVKNAGVWRVGPPNGCPRVRPPRPPHDWRYMRGFRKGFGLDLDLQGDQAAIDRRIRGLVGAWIRGNPVARVTQSEYGLPLSARDATELEYRDEYLQRDSEAIEHWAPRHARETFAGWDFDHEHGGIFYIGFVGDQEAQIAEFERQVRVLAPERIKPFPTPP
jgi:hypothetical protein